MENLINKEMYGVKFNFKRSFLMEYQAEETVENILLILKLKKSKLPTIF